MVRVLLRAIAIILLVSGSVAAQGNKNPSASFDECVIQNAVRFSPGPDAAPVLVEAALAKCADKLIAVAMSYQDNEKITEKVRSQLIESTYSSAKDQALIAVLEARSNQTK